MKKKSIIFIGFIISLIGCQDDDSKNDFEISTQLDSFYDNYLVPSTESFTVELNDLRASSLNFSEDITQENLDLLRDQWKNAVLAWKPLETFTIGPFTLTTLENQIYRWPIDQSLIEDFLSNTDLINSEFIAGNGVTTRGLSAVEFLIYSKTLQDFQDDEGGNLFNYLIGIIDVVIDKNIDYNNELSDYESEFKNEISSSLTGTQNQLINAIVEKIEEIRKLKLEDPLGIDTGGNVNTELLEAYLSEFSLALIKSEIESIEKLFTSDYNPAENNGIYAQLEATGNFEELLLALQNQFSTINNTLNSFNSTLEEQLVTDSTLIFKLDDEINTLVILIKNDLSSALGVVITFNDNDGD